jgi:DNA-binding NarL/FixJ family response regulator
MRRITVVVADTEPAGRAVCESVLRHEEDILIVAHAGQHEDAVVAAVELRPRILLCRLRLAATTGYSLLATLRQKCPATLGVLWTDDTVEENQLIVALANGARGFLNRNDLRLQLPRAMRAIDGGEAWVPRKMLGRILDRLVR